jgi:hypothetical protein
MGGVQQPEGTKGSLKWMQIAVNDRPDVLNDAIRRASGIVGPVTWKSPRRSDGYAEYRDAAFLQQIDCGHLGGALDEFWPQRGPQWDGLAVAGSTRLLVEAKSHVAEMCSPPSAAGEVSMAKISKSLAETAEYLGAAPRVPWGPYFYQLTNRLAHLWFLQRNGVDAKLILLNFLDDSEQGGPGSAAEWDAAYKVAGHVLGLPVRHKLSGAVAHVNLSVRTLSRAESLSA